jgi:murein DD-endopeptidase MepM/ murein hydrolase activator NlpD
MKLHNSLGAMWLIFLVAASCLLATEYTLLVQQSVQLATLKKEYSSYIAIVKKYMSAESFIDSQQSFTLVNRQLDFLKEKASVFLQNNFKEPLVSTQVKEIKKETKKNVGPFITRLDKFKSLKREGLFIWPIDKSHFYLSSSFGRRLKPDGSWGFHRGIDLAAVRGTAVKAAASGIVIEAHENGGYGNTVVIAHTNLRYQSDKTFKTRYAHLDKILVRKGQKVLTGECIGKVGSTGFVRKKRGGDGSHLHFEVHMFNKPTNPFYFLA